MQIGMRSFGISLEFRWIICSGIISSRRSCVSRNYAQHSSSEQVHSSCPFPASKSCWGHDNLRNMWCPKGKIPKTILLAKCCKEKSVYLRSCEWDNPAWYARSRIICIACNTMQIFCVNKCNQMTWCCFVRSGLFFYYNLKKIFCYQIIVLLDLAI